MRKQSCLFWHNPLSSYSKQEKFCSVSHSDFTHKMWWFLCWLIAMISMSTVTKMISYVDLSRWWFLSPLLSRWWFLCPLLSWWFLCRLLSWWFLCRLLSRWWLWFVIWSIKGCCVFRWLVHGSRPANFLLDLPSNLLLVLFYSVLDNFIYHFFR